MSLRTFFLGQFSPRTWQVLSILLIIQFQGMLALAWVFRDSSVSASTPFRNLISTLGQGRAEGNPGAWIFLCCFCLFALLLIPWHLNLATRVGRFHNSASTVLKAMGLLSLVGVACVGIFDERQMGPISQDLSRFMHGFGAVTAFGGHCVVAFLSWSILASYYRGASPEKRSLIGHPGKILVSVLLLVFPLILVCALQLPDLRKTLAQTIGGPAPEIVWRIPFWQWSLMIALMCWLYSMGRWYPLHFEVERDTEADAQPNKTFQKRGNK